MARTGFRAKQLDALEELGLIRSRRVDEQKVFASGGCSSSGVCVSLECCGTKSATWFPVCRRGDLCGLTAKVASNRGWSSFWAKAEASGEEDDLLGLAAHAIEEVTPLVVALRAKLLREVLESR